MKNNRISDIMSLLTAARKPLAVVALLFLTTVPASISATLPDQRSDFLKAESALKSNDMVQFKALKTRLAGYPLLPYIEYQELVKRLHQLDPNEADNFLQRYQAFPGRRSIPPGLSENVLGKQGKWNRVSKILSTHQQSAQALLPAAGIDTDWKNRNRPQRSRALMVECQIHAKSL